MSWWATISSKLEIQKKFALLRCSYTVIPLRFVNNVRKVCFVTSKSHCGHHQIQQTNDRPPPLLHLHCLGHAKRKPNSIKVANKELIKFSTWNSHILMM